MSMTHYDGPLGVFDYDNNEFCIELEPRNVTHPHLHYIGKETDGSKIHIPEGLEDASFLFARCCDLKSAPSIPLSVNDCSHMFSGTGIDTPPKIPDTVINCEGMFSLCTKLKNGPTIPSCVKNCNYMFYGCSNLVEAVDVPDGVENCDHMYAHCASLTKAPVLSSTIKICDSMFLGCKSLVEPPSFPDDIFTFCNVFEGCVSLRHSSDIPRSAECCASTLKGCKSITTPPMLPSRIVSCPHMFDGCESLESPPIIPLSVKNANGIFNGCNENVMLVGKWQLEHRDVSFADVFNEYLKKNDIYDVCQHMDAQNRLIMYDVMLKYETSDHNTLYGQIINDVRNGELPNMDLSSELQAADNCYRAMIGNDRSKAAEKLAELCTESSEDNELSL